MSRSILLGNRICQTRGKGDGNNAKLEKRERVQEHIEHGKGASTSRSGSQGCAQLPYVASIGRQGARESSIEPDHENGDAENHGMGQSLLWRARASVALQKDTGGS